MRKQESRTATPGAPPNPAPAGQVTVTKPTDAWDRRCPWCKGKMLMEAPRVYNQTTFECADDKCRAQVVIQDFYDKRGNFTHEEVINKVPPINQGVM